MPDYRRKYPQLGHSIKVSSLSHLEYRVWDTYQLTANDVGVLLKSAPILQGANLALAREPQRVIEAALDRLIDVKLVVPFDHQGLIYICDPVWQDYQKIKYPRSSPTPVPPESVLCQLSRDTQELFQNFLKNFAANVRAYARNPNPNPNPHSDPDPDPDPDPERSRARERVSEAPMTQRRMTQRQAFERFWATYPRQVDIDDAWLAWQHVNPSAEFAAEIIASVQRQCASVQWQRDGGQYIPNPAKWLRHGRWRDTLQPVPSVGRTTRALMRASAGFLQEDP